jgi:hypothetical protein
MDEEREYRLTGALGEWNVVLTTGDTIRLAAHGYSRDAGDYVFSALMEGRPHFEVTLCRIPQSLVRSLEGG